MYEWSVLKNSIPDFLAAPGGSGPRRTFLRGEVESVLFQLHRADSQESLYRLARVHRHWDSPLINRIFFSGLNLLRDRFGDFYINMLIEEFASAAYIPRSQCRRREADYARLIRGGAADIFPEFTSFKQEAAFDGFRVDLLARIPASGQSVLFELKQGTEDPTPQLLKYAAHFQSPVLIGITEKRLPPRRERGDIYYFTYEMLNCRAAANICRQFGGGCKPFDVSSNRFDRDFSCVPQAGAEAPGDRGTGGPAVAGA